MNSFNEARLKEIERQFKLRIFEVMSILAKVKGNRLCVASDSYNRLFDGQFVEALKTIKQMQGDGAGYEAYEFRPGYKVYTHLESLRGISGVRAFMSALYFENAFCAEYTDALPGFFKLISEQAGKPLEKLEINLFEPVFKNALFCDYLQKEHGTLFLTKEDCSLAVKLLCECDEVSRNEILFTALSRLNFGSTDYNASTLRSMLPRLHRAINDNTLDKFLTVE